MALSSLSLFLLNSLLSYYTTLVVFLFNNNNNTFSKVFPTNTLTHTGKHSAILLLDGIGKETITVKQMLL
jgi:hypothetical protein